MKCVTSTILTRLVINFDLKWRYVLVHSNVFPICVWYTRFTCMLCKHIMIYYSRLVHLTSACQALVIVRCRVACAPIMTFVVFTGTVLTCKLDNT